MAHELTIKGNPNQLTINQHFHSAHAISKFYNADGKVQVKLIESNEKIMRDKRAKIFVTKRTWDQKAEKGYMADIEDAFHEEIDEIKNFNARNHHAISKYFNLWKLRHVHHMERPDDWTLNGISGSGLTKEQEEILEGKEATFVREGGQFPSRFGAGLTIQMGLDRSWNICQNFKWGLLEATEGEFIVADCYTSCRFMPIAPSFAFFLSTEGDRKINSEQVADINKIAIEQASKFYYARDLSACPVA